MRVTQNDFGSHIDEFIDKEQTALKHFLMDRHISSRLGRDYEHYTPKSGVKPGQGASATVKIEPSM